MLRRVPSRDAGGGSGRPAGPHLSHPSVLCCGLPETEVVGLPVPPNRKKGHLPRRRAWAEGLTKAGKGRFRET